MATPIYAFTTESLIKALIKSLEIKGGKWSLSLDYGIQPQPNGILIGTVGFKLVPHDPMLHPVFVDATPEEEWVWALTKETSKLKPRKKYQRKAKENPVNVIEDKPQEHTGGTRRGRSKLQKSGRTAKPDSTPSGQN